MFYIKTYVANLFTPLKDILNEMETVILETVFPIVLLPFTTFLNKSFQQTNDGG